MTQYQVTLNEQTLQRLFSADSQLAQLLEAILNPVLDAHVSEQRRRERYERTEERQGYRNGYKPRHTPIHHSGWDTDAARAPSAGGELLD
jgi:putative transposase